MAKIIGTYEARTHWSEVIQEAKKGGHYVITHHGEPIAELVPPHPQTKQEHSKRLVCIRWYAAYPLSYWHLEEMMEVRSVVVDHSSINR